MQKENIDDKDLTLGEILLKCGFIDKERLSQSLEIQKVTGQKLGNILVEKGFLTEQQIVDALAQQYFLPIIHPFKMEIAKEILEIFPYQMLKKYNVLPIKIMDNSLIVATNNPLNISAFRELKHVSRYRIKLVMATTKEIELCLNKYYGHLYTAEEAIKEIVTEKTKEEKDIVTKEILIKELETVAQEAPVIKLVNSILAEAINQGTSDIHFEPCQEHLRVRFRIDGVLYEKMTIPKNLQPAVISRIKIIAGMDIGERRKPQDGRMSIQGENKEYDVRASTLPNIFGEKLVLRILDKKRVYLHLETLGIDEDELKLITSLIYQPYGMILVTGPTGSGKTTTLYSILNILNDTSKNIITVEDPVEYKLNGINQTSINIPAGYTFATAIKHILRQDPDVIMIGEIRDLETAEIAIQAALTGHIVLSTLHTNNTPGAITRLLNMNVEPFLISSAVIGVLAQRLLRELCPLCKKEYRVSDEVKKKITDFIPSTKAELTLAKAQGCEKCHNLGYIGRTAIFEILVSDEEIRELILKKASESEINTAAILKGMNILKVSGIKKALAKITSLEEVMRITFVEKI